MRQPPVTIVTGAGSGIGAATARLLADRGHRLVLCGRRAEPLRALEDELGARAVVGDMATEDGTAAAVDAALGVFGRLDGLVLNAGVMVPGTAASLTAVDWNATMAINVTGAFLLARAALPSLCASGGAIVAVASIGALRAGPEMAAYSASKAALIALMRSIAFDFAADGVRANCVSPGWVRTEMSDMEMDAVAARHGIAKDEAYALATSLVPQRRAAEPAEAAAAIAWLLGPESSYVTGGNLVVDGGTVIVDPGSVPLAAGSPHERTP
jgi:meso-butanediol dehydrogenase / (S,S)-butanediol dehydrogenase / diacetyl reductase